MNKLAVIMVIGVGLGAVAGVYWFRTNRLTAADIAEIAATQDRVAGVLKETANGADGSSGGPATEGEPAKAGLADAKAREEAEKAIAEAATKATDPLPPAVTIVPNESMPEKTPDTFTVLFETTKGDVAVAFTRDWAPNGADRIYELVMKKFFTDMRIFRVVEGFVVQAGIPGNPAVSAKWMGANIPDDPVKQHNTEGMFTFAAGGSPNTRSTQFFINLVDNSSQLDRLGFAPVGKVVFGMDVVKSFYSGYGESITKLQEQIATQGNGFLDAKFPKLDSIKRASFIESIVEGETMAARKRDEQLENRAAKSPGTQAPDTFKVRFECAAGSFVAECYRDWSPHGADRFYDLVKDGFFDDAKFFRVVPNFIVQFGLPADPGKFKNWVTSKFPDDPFKTSNTEGTLVFAKPSGINNARSTQIFINLRDNSSTLDAQSFTPFGKIIEGLDVVKAINSEYGEAADQGRIRTNGNAYLNEGFPNMDGIKSATLIDDAPQPPPAPEESQAGVSP